MRVGYIDLPPLSLIINNRPIDFTLAIDPKEILLNDSHPAQEDVLEQENTQLYDMIHHIYDNFASSDDSSTPSSPIEEEGFNSGDTDPSCTTFSKQESYDLTTSDSFYKNFYTFTTQAIKESDTTPSCPPLLQSTSILSTIENSEPPICHTPDLEFSVHADDTEDDEEEEVEMEEPSTVVVLEPVQEEERKPKKKAKKYKAREERKVKKRTRKNYNSDTITVLMDWYLANDGMIPNNEKKKILADLTGKSESQICTWFQNAKRRYIHKLHKFKSLSSKYPELVYDYHSYKSFLKIKK